MFFRILSLFGNWLSGSPYRERCSARRLRQRKFGRALEQLEGRITPTGNIAVTGASVVNSSNQVINTVNIGEWVYIQTDFSTLNLPSGASYRVATTVNGLTLNSGAVTWGAGNSGTGSWNLYWGTFLTTPGINQVTVTVDPDKSVAESTYADNSFSFSFNAVSPAAGTFISYTAAQMRNAYGVNSIPDFGSAVPDGTGETIAIINGGNDPSLFADVDGFDQTMSLTTSSTQTIYQNYGAAASFLNVFNQSGVNITANIANSGTNGVPALPASSEESWDVEWAHAMAPGAKIDEIEFDPTGNWPANLLTSYGLAGTLPNVSVANWSGGLSQWSTESTDDSTIFVTPTGHVGVTYVCPSNDNGANVYPAYGQGDSYYPSTSPNVLSVGGTTLTLNNDGYGGETGWSFPTPTFTANEGSASYAQTGTWSSQTGGFSGTYSTAAAGSSSTATWTIPISSTNTGWGTELSATWNAAPGNASNTTYSVYDGTTTTGTPLGTVTINQTQAPAGTADGSSQFQQLGTFFPTLTNGTGTLTVVVNANSANGKVVADAIGSAPAWASSGGPAPFETEPAYQKPFQNTGYRTTPDVSFDANFSADGYGGGGITYGGGGTSLGGPCWAGLLAIVNQGRVAAGGVPLNSSANPTQTLQDIYNLPASDFHDITTGYNGLFAGPGYDQVTGRGSPIANSLIPDMVAYDLAAPTVITPTAAGITSTTATLGGNVTSNGGGVITEEGVVYSPTSTNPNPQIGGTGVTKVTGNGTSGVFSVNVSSLAPGAIYSFAAYATNNVGTTYTSPATIFSTLTVNPPSVTGVYDASGNPVQAGATLASTVNSLSVAFSENMNAVTGGANSVTNPSNWLLFRYGVDVTNQISAITFGLNPTTLQFDAVVSFSLPLTQGGYQLIARQSMQDITGRSLSGSGGTSPNDFRLNFYVAQSVGVTTDVAPFLYNIEPSTLNAPAPQATPLTSSLYVFDADSINWTSATVQIAINYQSGEDVLNFSNAATPNITGSWNAATGTLTLSGTDTVSDYRTALHNVTYTDTSATPNTALTRTVDFQTNDGLLLSNVVTRDVTVMASSIPAVLSGVSGTGTYFQGYPAIALVPNLVITDPNVVNLSSATVSFTNWQGEDRLNFNNIFADQWTFTQDLVAHTATFTITGADLVDHYQTLLRSVIYWDVSGAPVTSARVASFSVTDGLSTSNIVTRNTIVSAVNQAPTLTSIESTPLFCKANDPAYPAQPISNTLLVGDPDSNNLTKATVQITSGYENDANGADVLAFTNQLGITGSFNATTGMLTLIGTSSVSNYRTALRSVTFGTSGAAPSTATRTLTINATDDYTPTPASSLSATRTVTVQTTNLPPALSNVPNAPLAYVRNAAAAAIAPGAVIYDPDSINLASATIQVSGNYQSGLDVLAATVVSGITQSFNATTGTLTLSGISSLANYQTVLQSVTFQTTSAANTLSRTISFVLNDDLANSATVTRGVTLT